MAILKTPQDALTEISEKLDSILGFMAIRGIENDAGAVVARLREFGMAPRAIAKVAGISENAVVLRLKRMKPKVSAKKKPIKKTAKAAAASVEVATGNDQGVST